VARLRFALSWLLLGAGACSGLGRDADLDVLLRDPAWRAAPVPPLVRQRSDEDCGAAALSMALSRWGERAGPEEIVRACPPLPGRGIRAGDLRDFARKRGLRAFVFEGRPEDLERELSRGRPLIVGLVKTAGAAAWTHYELAVAVREVDGGVATLDPALGARRYTRDEFFRLWDPAGRPLLLLYREGP
jgi:ABC-type bacteriocin/lantibiotic exporter with double-glycine peptidase domain